MRSALQSLATADDREPTEPRTRILALCGCGTCPWSEGERSPLVLRPVPETLMDAALEVELEVIYG